MDGEYYCLEFPRQQAVSHSQLESTTSPKPPNSASRASELGGLSVEVVEHILTFLPANDIVLCKRVSV